MEHLQPDRFGQNSRQFALVANAPTPVIQIPKNRDVAVTWLVTATNANDGTAAVITVDANYYSAYGTDTIISTEIGPRESVQFYVPSGVNIVATSGINANFQISIAATGGGYVHMPPLRFQTTPGAVAYLSLSANNGYAPPERRWITVYSDVNFDLQIRGSGGGIRWTGAAIAAAQPIGPIILPPGCRILGKGNVANAVLTCVWTQTRAG